MGQFIINTLLPTLDKLDKYLYWRERMLIIKIQKLLKDIENNFWNIEINDEEESASKRPQRQYLKGILDELQILAARVLSANEDPDIARIQVNIKDYPLLHKRIILIGPNTVIKWLKEEIRKEIQHKRDTEAKRQDNQNTTEMIDMVKNKKCRQSLDINPTHGTRVNWEKRVEKED